MRALRPLLVLLHRWFGLAAALFLFVAGATGAVISWDHELDAWLNPQLFHAASAGAAGVQQSGLVLADRVEAADPRVVVNYVLLQQEPGQAALLSVEGRTDPASGKPFEPGYNQVAVDPVSGQVQGKREWGTISLSRQNLLPFLYKLHYSMHIPDGWGIEFGIWLMGLIGMVWVLDCFIALWLAFPSWRGWSKSFAFRWRQGGHKRNFDLHRSGGVWVWALLLVLAVTSVGMNLGDEVLRPLIRQVSTLTPTPFETRMPSGPAQIPAPRLTRAQAVRVAQAEAARRGWTTPAGALFYAPAYGLYGINFFAPGHEHGDVGLGNPWLYVDAVTGQLAGSAVPGSGSAGDIFLQAQFPLHSGRILGLAGRIMISVMGALVAMLSATGLLIWLRKRRARRLALAPAGPRAGLRTQRRPAETAS